jgi:hypothetical protein
MQQVLQIVEVLQPERIVEAELTRSRLALISGSGPLLVEGPPGATRIRKKASVTITNSVGMAVRKRLST